MHVHPKNAQGQDFRKHQQHPFLSGIFNSRLAIRNSILLLPDDGEKPTSFFRSTFPRRIVCLAQKHIHSMIEIALKRF